MNYIIWNNKDSREIKGLLISELPPIRRPNMRVKETVIDGVDGSLIEELGYESYDKTVIIGLKIGADVDKVAEFFSGSGEVVFSNEPDKYYKARIINGIDFERLLRYKVAKVTFRVQPFKYSRVEVAREKTDPTDGDHSMIIENLGNHTARPIITIKGAGTISVHFSFDATEGNAHSFSYDFTEGEAKHLTFEEWLDGARLNYEGTVVIDCEKQDAYWEGTLKNRHLTLVDYEGFAGGFPVFKKGTTVLTWKNDYYGKIDSIKIEKYSRWL
jgi:predicted phage tail component-like protein